MIQFDEIIPVSLFKKNTKEYLSRIEFKSAPLLLTLHGRGAFVLTTVNSYMQMSELAYAGRHGLAASRMLEGLEGDKS